MNLAKYFGIGCGDNSCRWGARGGMGTNGGCRCNGERDHQPSEERLARRRGIAMLRELAESPSLLFALDALALELRSALVDEVKRHLIEAVRREAPMLSAAQLEEVLTVVEQLRRPR